MATRSNRPAAVRLAAPPCHLEFSAPAAFRPHLAQLKRKLASTLPHLPRNRLSEVAVALVGDKEMSRLHALSHDDPTPTDVLTYELEHDAKGNVTEGQVVICVPEARRRALDAKIPLGNELLLYALHGLLHLSGMNDLTDKDFRAIHLAEDRILTAIGVGAVFHVATASESAATQGKAPKKGKARR